MDRGTPASRVGDGPEFHAGGDADGRIERRIALTVELTERGLGREQVVAVARGGDAVRVGAGAVAAMERGAEVVARHVASDEPVYGVSTGFGALANTSIPAEKRELMQKSLVRSHAAGMGPEVETEVVRAMMVLRARSLSMGYSGVRPLVAEGIVGLLNASLTPVVPEYGSLGASGDLAPLAHAALPLLGEGVVRDADGELLDAADALSAAGLAPIELMAEGVSA